MAAFSSSCHDRRVRSWARDSLPSLEHGTKHLIGVVALPTGFSPPSSVAGVLTKSRIVRVIATSRAIARGVESGQCCADVLSTPKDSTSATTADSLRGANASPAYVRKREISSLVALARIGISRAFPIAIASAEWWANTPRGSSWSTTIPKACGRGPLRTQMSVEMTFACARTNSSGSAVWSSSSSVAPSSST